MGCLAEVGAAVPLDEDGFVVGIDAPVPSYYIEVRETEMEFLDFCDDLVEGRNRVVAESGAIVGGENLLFLRSAIGAFNDSAALEVNVGIDASGSLIIN